MPENITNRLSFLSNDKTILAFIKSRHPGNECPVQFSLNSIKHTPRELILALSPPAMVLSIMNVELPELDEKTRQAAMAHLSMYRQGEEQGKASGPAIEDKIGELRTALTVATHSDDPSTRSMRDNFEQAVSNYRQHGFFSHFDWRMTTWGTAEDIVSVNAATFKRPTQCIEFETVWTPPIAALQLLANTFPSVRFRLTYRHADDPWQEVEFFPFPPFGY